MKGKRKPRATQVAPPLRRGGAARAGKVAISRLPLHEQAADRLRDLIVSGELAEGEKVPVAELSEQLEVSITPLREALKVLAGEQLVELMPNRGARVTPVTIEDTRDLFEVMSGIEAMAAELAAARMTADELAHLEELHAEMRAHHEADRREPYFTLNRKIHDTIVAYAGNPVLSHVRRQLAVRAERVRALAVRKGTRRAEAMTEHEALMEALRAHDPRRAAEVWRDHLLKSGEDTRRILAERADA